jgi:hypothetical protein
MHKSPNILVPESFAQSVYSEITTNTTTTSTSYVNLLTNTITTGANKVIIIASISGLISATGFQIDWQITLNGTPVRGGSYRPSTTVSNSGALFYNGTIGQGAHTILLQWRVGSGTGTINPATGTQHASLSTSEVFT